MFGGGNVAQIRGDDPPGLAGEQPPQGRCDLMKDPGQSMVQREQVYLLSNLQKYRCMIQRCPT